LIANAIPSVSGVEDDDRELQVSTVSIDPEGVRVVVRDTGPGLRPQSLPRLFEPFYTTKPDGMSIGLSICRLIIEAHGGGCGRPPASRGVHSFILRSPAD
jgi:signal transduction histidine kinase